MPLFRAMLLFLHSGIFAAIGYGNFLYYVFIGLFLIEPLSYYRVNDIQQ